MKKESGMGESKEERGYKFLCISLCFLKAGYFPPWSIPHWYFSRWFPSICSLALGQVLHRLGMNPSDATGTNYFAGRSLWTWLEGLRPGRGMGYWWLCCCFHPFFICPPFYCPHPICLFIPPHPCTILFSNLSYWQKGLVVGCWCEILATLHLHWQAGFTAKLAFGHKLAIKHALWLEHGFQWYSGYWDRALCPISICYTTLTQSVLKYTTVFMWQAGNIPRDFTSFA